VLCGKFLCQHLNGVPPKTEYIRKQTGLSFGVGLPGPAVTPRENP
jgi:hypothetical protein